jgi:hypothetical protein
MGAFPTSLLLRSTWQALAASPWCGPFLTSAAGAQDEPDAKGVAGPLDASAGSGVVTVAPDTPLVEVARLLLGWLTGRVPRTAALMQINAAALGCPREGRRRENTDADL